MELATGAHIDRYVVEARLRSSLVSTVFRLRHLDDGTLHALKVLNIDRPTLQDRILAEGRAQARLRHRNVVAFTDVLDVGGSPGLLMDFVPGPTLEQVLAHTRLDLEVVEQLVPGILAGVAAAHEAQIVHRDLKPANVLLDIRDGTIVPKIADFGLARLLGQHRTGITASGATLTTPNYMSPEQVRNARSVEARSDLFALGAIVYELVTGHRAFDNENVFAILSDITGGHWVPVGELRPEVPARVVEAIEAALELDVEDRVTSAEELWSIWAGPRASDLASAAERPLDLPPPWFERIAELSPEVDASASARATPRFVPWPNLARPAVLAIGLGLVMLVLASLFGSRAADDPRYVAVDGTARLRVVGEAVRVRLVGWRGAEPRLDRVPPGTYRLEVDHGTGEWLDVGRPLELEEGDDVLVRCDVREQRCRW